MMTPAARSVPERLRNLIEQIEHADQVDSIRLESASTRQRFLDSAPTVIPGAGGANEPNTSHQRSNGPSSADPVRVFQNCHPRSSLRGPSGNSRRSRLSIESFPLFGLKLEDYDSLFAENLDLLLEIRENEHVYWSGKHRAPLTGQGVYPRPLQNPLPIWLGVGGTPKSFARAGELGLPLMVAIIGGETRRFRPLVDLYREAGARAGHSPDRLKVGVHSLGYVASTTQEAADDFFPGYARAVTDVGKERGWPAVTRAGFDAQRGKYGALLVGEPDEVAEKIVRHSEALGGIARITFQMNAASLPNAKLIRAIELLGTGVAPAVREALGQQLVQADRRTP
jgi:hypothetical protein